MEEYKNSKGTSNDVGILDDVGIDMVKNQLLSLYAEEDAFVQMEATAKESSENYKKQWVIDERLLTLQLENFGMIESAKTHKVHEIQEFWDLQKEQFSFKVRHETFNAEQQLAGYIREIESSAKNLVTITKEIANKTEQLKALGEEIPARDTNKKVY